MFNCESGNKGNKGRQEGIMEWVHLNSVYVVQGVVGVVIVGG